jgi:hypothetical protein
MRDTMVFFFQATQELHGLSLEDVASFIKPLITTTRGFQEINENSKTPKNIYKKFINLRCLIFKLKKTVKKSHDKIPLKRQTSVKYV